MSGAVNGKKKQKKLPGSGEKTRLGPEEGKM